MSNSTGKARSTLAARAARMCVAATLASLVCAPAAYAVVNPSAGLQTGKGQTDVYVQAYVGDEEHGGTDVDPDNPMPITDPNNPDYDEHAPGKNIAFTVPTKINFVTDAAGNLTGPTTDKAYIENRSVFSIHATSFEVAEATNPRWHIIADGDEATEENSADFQFGPSADMLDAHDYLTRSAVKTPSAWNMAPGTSTGTADRVLLNTSGNIFNVTADLSAPVKIATINTYVKAGTTPTTP